ncbi:LysR family transcriptional regulator [Acetobacter fallax]|uniref:LysR family transcriptional regulator n=1 Tax=Acetobacter fallax TaxID=1737473 RepID=A0ABX0KD86_9PROT|nr:LysR family transcriptional regulator [Acetobacter fallax]NHO33096.1 LysR family transcriptional regulator [Acetobacter fallax]NHO36755.1 LysR family transcriptional regulator [Acetobacter fallax]
MRGYDLDLLRYLQVLIEEESVSASARRLKVSEPAMSRHLAKLRAVFRDPILVQSGRRMMASSFALGIMDRVQEVVRAADSLIETRALANLRNLTPTFTIRANDLIVAALGLPLLRALRQDCPHCELVFAPEVDDPASDPLRHGSIDLYIGATDAMKSEIRRQTIFRDTMCALVRKDHPIFSAGITPETMTRYEYISVSRRGRAQGPIDAALRDHHGLTRRIAMVVPNYHAMIESMKDTDLILPLPGIVLDHISVKALGLATFEFPLSLPCIEAFQAWHPRRDTDPVHRWLRETLFRVSHTVFRNCGVPSSGL